MKLTAAEWLIKQVKAKEWQDLHIWHKEDVFQEALHREWAQTDKIKQTNKKDEKL